jgi:enoyl-CoA hydratase/carnithine racemase
MSSNALHAALEEAEASASTRVVLARSALERVFVAVVGGYAFGGGLELTLGCDLVIASESAVFAFPETRLGLLPGRGGTHRIARAVSPQRARERV